MRLASLSRDNLECFTSAHSGDYIITIDILKIYIITTISDLSFPNKATKTTLYLGAMNFGNADFPVYCHDNSSVDPDSLKYPPSEIPDGFVFFHYNSTSPLTDSYFGLSKYPTVGWSMLCQDL
jgi:hypothetical protein